jgi:nucleoside-diphosphate-sugar epimerase
MKILITGGNGYIARNIKPLFEQKGYEVLAPSHKELDLTNYDDTTNYLRNNKFDAVIHAAAKGVNTKQNSFEEIYVTNIKMFDSLAGFCTSRNIPLIIYGSGAEYDIRHHIRNEYPSSIINCWPMDPYGLSKNIICRRALQACSNAWILRLFGCFNYDELSTRFIKRSILRVKEGLPIQIHKDKQMDFFYLDDVFAVTEYIINNTSINNTEEVMAWGRPWNGIRNLNLTYKEKYSLLDIANIIKTYTGTPNKDVEIVEFSQGLDYTGESSKLYTLPISENFIGLDRGIRLTCQKLL